MRCRCVGAADRGNQCPLAAVCADHLTDMETHVDVLRPLAEDEVEELLQLYRSKYGTRNFHYLLMYNQCKWNRQLRQLNVGVAATPQNEWVAFEKAFYTHRDCDFRQYGTYVSLHVDLKQSVSFHSWEPDLKQLWQCLRETRLIEWRRGPLLTNVDLHLCEGVKEIAASKGSSVQRARVCAGLILQREKALQLKVADLPAGYVLDKLTLERAEMIHSLWPNKKEGSLQSVKGLMQINQALGIYRMADGELVAWVFQNDFAGLGMLQVQPAAQRLGLGSILAAELSKRIAVGEEVHLSAWVVVENFKSKALLKKIGYEQGVINEWIQLNEVI